MASSSSSSSTAFLRMTELQNSLVGGMRQTADTTTLATPCIDLDRQAQQTTSESTKPNNNNNETDQSFVSHLLGHYSRKDYRWNAKYARNSRKVF